MNDKDDLDASNSFYVTARADDELELEDTHRDEFADDPCPRFGYTELDPYSPSKTLVRYDNALRNLLPYRRTNKNGSPMPVDSAGWWSFVTMSWLNSLMWKSYRKTRGTTDFPQCSKTDEAMCNASKLRYLWQQEVTKKGLKNSSLLAASWRMIRTRVIMGAFCYFLCILFGFLGPMIFLRKFLEHLEKEDSDVKYGVGLAFGLVLCELMRIIFFVWMYALNYRTAIRLRGACMGILFQKIMHVDSFGGQSTGQIINLFASDSQRIFDLITIGPLALGGPLVLLGGLVYMVWLLGGTGVLGVVIVLLFYPVQIGLSKLIGKFRRKTAESTDRRVKVISDLISSMKHIKLFILESIFEQKLSKARKNERKWLEWHGYMYSLNIAIAPIVPIVAGVVTILVYTATGHNVTASEAFSMVALLMSEVRKRMVYMFLGCQAYEEGKSAYQRFQNVLKLGELNPLYVTPIDRSQAVCIGGGRFMWIETPVKPVKRKRLQGKRFSFGGESSEMLMQSSAENVSKPQQALRNIDFRVKKGHLVGVCGTVGSGKTALLYAIMGQLRVAEGSVALSGNLAYVEQDPWILSTTIKDNVLFGEAFHSKRYYNALYCCCLNDDVTKFSNGDETLVGERGHSLSGGQKQRLSLARAVYANKDIYLLDNPMSSLDTETAAHVFHHCIRGQLKGKTVIMVTNQLQYLPHCDEVALVTDGTISEQGPHSELIAAAGEYAQFYEASCSITTLGLAPSSPLRPSDEKEKTAAKTENGLWFAETDGMSSAEIPLTVYREYMVAAGGYLVVLLILLVFALSVFSSVFSSYWLAHWIKKGAGPKEAEVNLNMTQKEKDFSKDITENPDLVFYQLIYAATVLAMFVFSILRGLMFVKASLRASSILHKKLFMKILTASIRFFDVTPAGRILNLLSKDVDEVDMQLPRNIETLIQNVFVILGSLILISYLFPWFLIAVFILGIIFVFYRNVFRVAIRDLKFYENACRSPLYGHAASCVHGLHTIRAFNKTCQAVQRFLEHVDANSSFLYLFHCGVRWLAFRMDLLSVGLTACVCLIILVTGDSVSPALAGLALTSVIQLSGIFQFTVRISCVTEARFLSVHRLSHYIHNVESEGVLEEERSTPSDWPKLGNIVFENVLMRYRPGLPSVLDQMSFHVEGGEKIGICGKTGAGKTSMGVVLSRLVGLEGGRILIDRYDISTTALHDLRSRAVVCPQDPVLFEGTIRENLDPWASSNDEAIWRALAHVTMKTKICNMDKQLQANVRSFSQGEKQLLCLAKVLLANPKILFLDESVSSLDDETIEEVLKNIWEVMNTVLVVAHKLSIMMRCDRVLVIDDGRVKESGVPSELAKQEDSLFGALIRASHIC